VAEHDYDTEYHPDTNAQQDNRLDRRGPNVFILLVGLGVLCASAYVISDGNTWLPPIDPRWLLAGGALVVGLLLLIASLRPRRR
jgi:hypothetical protein